jgi:hypothetical protein
LDTENKTASSIAGCVTLSREHPTPNTTINIIIPAAINSLLAFMILSFFIPYVSLVINTELVLSIAGFSFNSQRFGRADFVHPFERKKQDPPIS